ncbi:MAG TPA: ATP-dependent DNA helicase RecG [Mycobacterium sp.]
MVTLTERLDCIVGAKAATSLEEEFGIRTVDDLLHHYPRSYVEGAAVRGETAERPTEGQHITIVDTITFAKTHPMKSRKGEYLVIAVGSGRNKISATFFNAKGIKWQLTPKTKVMLSGEVGFFRGAVQLTHPAYLVLESADGGPTKRNVGSDSLRNIADASEAVSGEVLQSEFERSCYPIYSASTKLQSWDIFRCVRQVLEVLDPVPDPLPAGLRAERSLIGEDEALRAIHLAETQLERRRALERLTFDEAVGLQWALAGRRHGELSQSGPAAPSQPDGLAAELLRRLPFELTAGQREVLDVLGRELGQTRPMNRLLQGEVGSGKTIVSVLAMLQMVDADYQCALLAPTEVLAAQHVRSICDVLGPLALGGQLGGADNATAVALLTGSMSAAQKKQVRAEIASGQAGIVIGTHALLQDAVEFHQLGMVVVDEQHRFGVEQRDQLRAKAPVGITPHLLVMTATPIPRTVALTVYGDLETSTLRELPRGRQPISTSAIFAKEKPEWLGRAWQRIREEVAAGRQAYVVAPRIDETEQSDQTGEDQTGEDQPGEKAERARPSATAVELFTRLQSAELAGLRLGLMHGRLPAEEKDAAMAAFRSGAIDVLVCTTVIEVGVDVPNATVMLVMDADRFGISQLHQLRGRIGRGAHQSLCLLATWASPGSGAGRRVQAVAATLDGFALADLDLKERREGDVLGRNQSGRRGSLKLLSLTEHGELIEAARNFCTQTWEANSADPGLGSLAARFTDTDRIEYLDKA